MISPVKFQGHFSPLLEVRVRHILLKHEDSRNPNSWRDNGVSKVCMRTRAQAYTILKQLLIKWQGNCTEEEFCTAAFEVSDCSSAKRMGDLGFFPRGKMQPKFEKEAFALDIGRVSDIVDSDSGYHLIMRIG